MQFLERGRRAHLLAAEPVKRHHHDVVEPTGAALGAFDEPRETGPVGELTAPTVHPRAVANARAFSICRSTLAPSMPLRSSSLLSLA
jgi:hypothetical protein